MRTGGRWFGGEMNTEIIQKQKEYIDKIKEINGKKKLYYHILTFGCQLNENDSEKLCGMLEQIGYERTDNIELADIYVMNTCCVRENAEEKVFGKLRRI